MIVGLRDGVTRLACPADNFHDSSAIIALLLTDLDDELLGRGRHALISVLFILITPSVLTFCQMTSALQAVILAAAY